MEKMADLLGSMITSNTMFLHGKQQASQSPQDPEELAYTCDICGKFNEPIRVEFPKALGGARYIRRRCECLQKENLQAVERFKNYGRQQYFERYFSYSTLGPRFKGKTFDTFEASAHTSIALKKAKQFVLSALNAKSPEEKAKGLIFIGPVGTGKTHLASAIYNELRNHEKACIFVNVPELLDRFRASYRTDSNENEDELLIAVKKCDLLVLDDLGAERHKNESDWATEKLFTIFDYRYRNYLPIIGTTNCQPDELEQKIGSRIISRIREMCDLTPCLGEDYRKRNASERRTGT